MTAMFAQTSNLQAQELSPAPAETAKGMPQVSDEGTDVWYYIVTANTELGEMCITDIDEKGDSKVKFAIAQREADNQKQQWKLMKPLNAQTANVHFVNRATGNIIQTRYDFDGYYNAQATKDAQESNGWKIEVVKDDQMKISGRAQDGLMGYLNVSAAGQDVMEIPAEADFANSPYAWFFVEATAPVGVIDNPFDEVSVYVADGKIIVSGADDYTLTHISGVRVPNNQVLPAGVYLVTIQGRTQSVLVK